MFDVHGRALLLAGSLWLLAGTANPNYSNLLTAGSISTSERILDEDTIVIEAAREARAINDLPPRLRQVGWPGLLPIGPCFTSKGHLGRCTSFRQCYPYFKLPELNNWETWILGMYDTCSYFTGSGRQMFGVCCANPGKPPPQKPPSVVGPEPVVVEEEEQGSGGAGTGGNIPDVWPPPIPTHSPGNTIPPIPTNSFPPGWPGAPEEPTTPATVPTTAPTRPTLPVHPGIPGWPPTAPTHPPTTTPTRPTLPVYPGIPGWPPTAPTHPPTTPPTRPTLPVQPGIPGWPPTAPTHPPTTPPTRPTLPVQPGIPGWPPTAPTHPTKPPTIAPPVTEAPVFSGSCGAKNAPFSDPDQDFRIVGGHTAEKGEWPWIAALFNGGRQFCGGSLIDNIHILTAAHCVAYMDAWDVARLTVHLGDHNIKVNYEVRHIEKRVQRVVRHRGFDSRTLYNDIAILTLDSAVTFSKQVKPICLPSGAANYAGLAATVIGWGSLREGGPQPNELQEVTIPIWTNQDCKIKYGHAAPGGIVEHFLCAGQANQDSCSGDSGGPLMVSSGGSWTQIGVVSWGIGCGKGQYPGVYTRVTHFLPWIQKNLK